MITEDIISGLRDVINKLITISIESLSPTAIEGMVGLIFIGVLIRFLNIGSRGNRSPKKENPNDEEEEE